MPSGGKNMGNNIYFKRFLLSFMSVVVVFTITELVVRQKASYIVSPTKNLVEADMDYLVIQTPSGKRMRPDANVLIKNHFLSHRDVNIRTDSYGFRGAELPKVKDTNTVRILVLGDSITQGGYIKEEDVYVAKIGEYLRKNTNIGNKKIEVVNGGIGDIGTKEEVDYLEDTGLKIQPDIVIIGFYLNDSRLPWGFPGEIGRPNWFRRNSVLIDTIYKQFKLNRFIKEKGIDRMNWSNYTYMDWKKDPDAFKRFASLAYTDWGASWEKNSWKTIDAEFQRLKKLSEKNNFKVVIAVLPVVYQVNADFVEDYPQRMAKEEAEKFDFKYVDLLPVLRKNRDKDLYFDWCHPKEIGNDIIGHEISDYLASSILKN